ncbi:hypothetical protein F5Y08DRAFT_318636 [Xylaria arbuscula]|nr:hypothetical protein F5Y08DRAFT_318636 [Xylaria arbuscula]
MPERKVAGRNKRKAASEADDDDDVDERPRPRKAAKKEKDPNKDKKPNCFMCFRRVVMAEIATYAFVHNGDISTIVGKMWAPYRVSPELKKPWTDEAAGYKNGRELHPIVRPLPPGEQAPPHHEEARHQVHAFFHEFDSGAIPRELFKNGSPVRKQSPGAANSPAASTPDAVHTPVTPINHQDGVANHNNPTIAGSSESAENHQPATVTTTNAMPSDLNDAVADESDVVDAQSGENGGLANDGYDDRGFPAWFDPSLIDQDLNQVNAEQPAIDSNPAESDLEDASVAGGAGVNMSDSGSTQQDTPSPLSSEDWNVDNIWQFVDFS